MVSGAGIEGERRILSARVVRAIQSIKEVVKNHSDADIYVALQETNMDPNETAQKLLNQDPFHEVRRKRDKKKDVSLPQNTGYRGSIEVRKPIERVEQIMKSKPTDYSVPRGGYNRNSSAGGSSEFRVVRYHRINNNVSREVKPSSFQSSTSTRDQKNLQVSEKGSTVVNQKSSGGNHSPRQASEVQTVSHTVVPKAQQGPKLNDSKPVSTVLPSNHSVLGVYSSSSDPVHVPSSDSRSAANVKRELGAVGVRRHTSVTSSSAQSNSISISPLVKDGTSSSEPLKSSTVTSKIDQPTKTSKPESVLPSMSGSRSSSSNQFNSRPHQQLVGHKKASQPAKEWKRKAGPKLNTKGHGVVGSSEKSVSHPTDSSQDLEINTAHVRDELARVDIYENQNVFIAEHIRVSDCDRSRLTFGTFGTEVDSLRTTASESLTDRAGENPSTAASTSLSSSVSESSIVATSASKHVDLLDDQVRNPGLSSPASGRVSENLLHDKKGTSIPQNLDHYTDIGMVRDNSPIFTHTESQQHQDPTELASFSVYNPQAGYESPYFRTSMDEPVRGQGLQSSQEVLGSHMNVPVSSISMVQQQQQPMPQMYQQVHVSPFPNLMPYRQYISPVYVPPMPMTGYSANPNYPHPSNGNNFVMMPGANNVKYGIQQFKPVPSGSPTGFGNFATPSGYTINAPGVVGGATGLEDSSRLKYKDGNLFVPNPQAETSEVWVQNPREFPNMQSASYYNMAGQTSHGAYMPPHPGHTSFNAAAAQSSHMQFPGLYHPPPPPPQVSGMATHHHLGPAGNVNLAMASSASVAPGSQMSAYQQPQMSHLNWNNANF